MSRTIFSTMGLGTIGAHDGQRSGDLSAAHELDRLLSDMPLVGVSSILMMRSPAITPARAAGVSSMGEMTLTKPSSAPTSMPRPPNSPRGGLHFAEGLGVQVGRVRIQVGHHAGDRVADERLVINRFDIVVLIAAKTLLSRLSSSRAAGCRASHGGYANAQHTPAATAPVAISPKPRNLRVPMHTSRILFRRRSRKPAAGCPTDVPTSGCQ